MASTSEAAPDVWIVDGTMVATAGGHEETGERISFVALRIASVRNQTSGQERDDRTFVLGLDAVVNLLGGLLDCGSTAFGRGTVMTAMADALGVDPRLRDEAFTAVDEAVKDIRRDEL